MDVSKLVNHGGGDGDGDDNGGEPSEQRGTAAASPLLESIVLRAVEMQQQTLRAQVREASKGWTGPILTSGGGAQMRAEAEARRATIETRDLAVQQNAAFQQAQEKRTKDSHVNTRLTMLLALFVGPSETE